MKKLLFTLLTSLLFTSSVWASHQDFDTGSSLNSFGVNQYITGKVLDVVQKRLYSMPKENLPTILQRVTDKITEIQNSNITLRQKNLYIGVLTELNSIISQIIENQKVDMDQIIKDITSS